MYENCLNKCNLELNTILIYNYHQLHAEYKAEVNNLKKDWLTYNKFVEMDKHESMKQFLNKSENVDNQ